MKRTATFAAAAAVICASSLASAGVTIYGGPTYDAATASGIIDQTSPNEPGLGVGNGVAAGEGTKYVNNTSVGRRGFRITAGAPTPAVELGALGTDTTGFTRSGVYASSRSPSRRRWPRSASPPVSRLPAVAARKDKGRKR